ncbi:MAG: hypothetical protein HFI49_02770 [Bacilli bacterium]|jgi:hypothetical protein|nr:hypothetical protein [Clostridia bacterium]MCI9281165.1 hypothetical protein [Bacilli bacterium]
MIEIIEKEPFRFEDTNIRPVVMIKDGKEIYIRNKVYIGEKEYERTINVLKVSDGKYTIFYGAYDNPFDMLQDISEKKQLIKKDLKEIFDNSESEGDFTDFIGTTSPSYSIFNYRIFDTKLLQDIKEIVELINRKEWNMAKVKIEEKRKEYNEITKNIKDKTLGLEFHKFYQLIDKQLETVKDRSNYKIFKDDVAVLKNVNTGTGLASITANNWLKHICNLSEIELKEYVDSYKQGLLNPYEYENLKQEDEELEV